MKKTKAKAAKCAYRPLTDAERGKMTRYIIDAKLQEEFAFCRDLQPIPPDPGKPTRRKGKRDAYPTDELFEAALDLANAAELVLEDIGALYDHDFAETEAEKALLWALLSFRRCQQRALSAQVLEHFRHPQTQAASHPAATQS